MIVQAINFTSVNSPLKISSEKPLRRINSRPKLTQVQNLSNISRDIALAQMPNVTFCAKHCNYGQDNFSAYENYSGPTPPPLEIEKYQKTLQVQQYIDEENYLAAIRGKIELARICRQQGKEHDAYMLEESIRALYKDLPIYQRDEAKSAIGAYNHDMAKYIDKDTGIE